MLIEVTRAGINFADTHARENSYLASYELPLIPGAEVAGVVGGQRVVGLVGMGGYAEYAVAPQRGRLPAARRRLRRRGARAGHPGPERLAPAEDLRPPGRGGERRRPRGGGRRRLARGPARQALRRRPRDRHGVERGEARAGARARRQVAVDSRGRAQGALREANGGPRSTSCSRWRRQVFDQRSARSRRSGGSSPTAGVARADQVSDGALMARSQAIVVWLMHCFAAAEISRAAAGAVRAGRAASCGRRGGTYGLSEAPRAHHDLQARRTAASTARPVALDGRFHDPRTRLHAPRGVGQHPPGSVALPTVPLRRALPCIHGARTSGHGGRAINPSRPSRARRARAPGSGPATRTRSPTVRYGPPASRSSTKPSARADRADPRQLLELAGAGRG